MQRLTIIDSHTGGEPTRLVVDGGPDLGTRAACRAPRALPARVRPLPLGRRQRAARLGRDRRRAARRAGGPRLRRRRDLLQQRRLPRHVRPRHDRPGRDAGASRAGSGPACIASKRRSAPSPRRCTRTAKSPWNNVPSWRERKDVTVDVPGHRRGDGRRRLGRQLVLPGRGARPGARARERRGAHRFLAGACARR